MQAEVAAVAGAAFDPNLAPHQLGQRLRYFQAQAGTAIVAHRTHFGLLKALEQLVDIGLSNADAGVCDFKFEFDRFSRAAHQPQAEADLALVCELDRIAHQVEEHLFEAGFIDQHPGCLRYWEYQVKTEPFPRSQGLHQGTDVTQQRAWADRRGPDAYFSGLQG